MSITLSEQEVAFFAEALGVENDDSIVKTAMAEYAQNQMLANKRAELVSVITNTASSDAQRVLSGEFDSVLQTSSVAEVATTLGY